MVQIGAICVGFSLFIIVSQNKSHHQCGGSSIPLFDATTGAAKIRNFQYLHLAASIFINC